MVATGDPPQDTPHPYLPLAKRPTLEIPHHDLRAVVGYLHAERSTPIPWSMVSPSMRRSYDPYIGRKSNPFMGHRCHPFMGLFGDP